MRVGPDAPTRPAVLTATLLGLTLLTGAACAPRMATIALPDGPGRPLDAGAVHAAAEALAAPCRHLRALTADLRIAGRIAGEKVRGTLQVGVSDDAVRIEGVPPFGAPVFVLAGRAETATLVFIRDGVYVQDAPVAALTEAIVGVALAPSDLLWLLGGCGVSVSAPIGATRFGADWVRLDLAAGVRAWLSTSTSVSAPMLRVVETPTWRVEYDARPAGQPLRGTLHGKGTDATWLTFEVEAPERLGALPAAALDVTIPRNARAIPLDDLRRQRILAGS